MNASPVTTAVTAAGVTPAPGQGQAGLSELREEVRS